ncbi:MAG TPA: ATP-binding protein [Verrucomicrobiae bacterium]|nr:ATP-binding protein [Verrucomicrobiae bacterium]
MMPNLTPHSPATPDACKDARALQYLQQNQECLRFLAEHSRDLVIKVTCDGKILSVSPNVKAVLGYTPEELLHASVFERVHADDLPQVQEQFGLAEGAVTFRYRHSDGPWRWLEAIIRGFFTPASQKHRVLMIHDITDRKHAEAERQRLETHLRQNQRLEALGTLASGIAHDFNNLLAVIIGYTELALMDAHRPQEAVKHLLHSQKASERARELVRQILAFSRKEKHECEAMPLQSVIKESLELMRHTLPATIEIDAQIDPEASAVLADPTKIHQVVMNLCTNAAHAMKQRPGRLIISLKNCDVNPPLAETIPDLQAGRFVQISVSDTGHGMDVETLKHIFEPFFTTKKPGEGTGLGLPVVHGIVREHRGAITVRSELGIGTTFDIYLPASECTPPENKDSAQPLLRGMGEHILLVDDEPSVCAALRVLIMRLGYRVTAETSPIKALKIFEESPDEFNLLISDLTMPHMTGVDLAQQILQIRPKLPVLLASGSSDDLTADADEVRQFGVCDLLPKPASLSTLADLIHKSLRANQSR